MVTGRLPQVVTELRSGLYMTAKNEMDLQTHLSKIWTILAQKSSLDSLDFDKL